MCTGLCFERTFELVCCCLLQYSQYDAIHSLQYSTAGSFSHSAHMSIFELAITDENSLHSSKSRMGLFLVRSSRPVCGSIGVQIKQTPHFKYGGSLFSALSMQLLQKVCPHKSSSGTWTIEVNLLQHCGHTIDCTVPSLECALGWTLRVNISPFMSSLLMVDCLCSC